MTRVGYAEVSSMKTSQLKKRDEDDRVISKVQIVLKKLPEFETLFAEFEVVKQARREEYNSGKPREERERRERVRPQRKPQEDSKVVQQHQEGTPEKPAEDAVDGGSADAPTSAKSQSTPERVA